MLREWSSAQGLPLFRQLRSPSTTPGAWQRRNPPVATQGTRRALCRGTTKKRMDRWIPPSFIDLPYMSRSGPFRGTKSASSSVEGRRLVAIRCRNSYTSHDLPLHPKLAPHIVPTIFHSITAYFSDSTSAYFSRNGGFCSTPSNLQQCFLSRWS